jgi:hypothetical protein
MNEANRLRMIRLKEAEEENLRLQRLKHTEAERHRREATEEDRIKSNVKPMTKKTSPSHVDRSSVCSGPLTMLPQCLISLRSKEKASRETTSISLKPGLKPIINDRKDYNNRREFADFGVF